ncbi:glycine cleavage system protein GcvH [Crenobacter sp. SG2303]|uniref:Glycine cleavage system H protein n=1 Tax=Crenobacter oryzisoli TaxID=3056844 RepID=A0ABT7XTA0_9NEIS|nr:MULTISPECIES: glycine cleavage system protein GcvH [unclassified Crenobacter]MDN0077021.1 glycine cleavage system protein GcvH [Crenobacter sp. SG2303]MDN0082781.1 glycine cleavage system protein GcvH [Crenobacter sp. SG2305]MDN0082799.1 glycine cleavage system protein GcvH [Crenobacter sp. SG2305]
MSETKYTDSHEWLRLEDDGSVTVGITEYAQNLLGDLVYVALPKEGQSFAKGEEAATIESVKAAGEIALPVDGTIVAVNSLLADEPSLVNDAPEGDGWFFRIQLANPAQLDGLLDDVAYQNLIGQ